MSILKHNKEYDYFACFCKVGEVADQAATYLAGAVTNFNISEVDVYAEDMRKMENAADIMKHELCDRLAHEFMPPIDREDISALSEKLDDIVDSVEDVMRKMYMFNISEVRGEAVEFVRLVTESCSVLKLMLADFSNFKKSKSIRQNIIEINTIENKGDKLHAESIRRLFSENCPPTEQLAWTKIFDSFETALDACEDAADYVDNIITKNT